jgi:holliday junction DNA helicase RuvA
MIAMLAGAVDEVGEDAMVLDVNGVGYLVHASARTLRQAPGRGEPLKLLIETHLREDRIQLYGFIDEGERAWFKLLNTVQGVGGRVALAILSTLEPDALATAIAAQDKAALARADGVGQKLAQRIAMELRDKAGEMAPGAGAGATATPSALINDAVSALVNLGYAKSAAYGAVTSVARRLGDGIRIEALVRAGLQELGR